VVAGPLPGDSHPPLAFVMLRTFAWLPGRYRGIDIPRSPL
jgi:hypothetical protein